MHRLISDAIYEESEKCIDLILHLGGDLNLDSDEGYSPIIAAVYAERFDLVEAALKAGANPFIFNLQRLAANRKEPIWRTIRSYQREYRKRHAAQHQAIRQMIEGDLRLDVTAQQAQAILFSYKKTTLLHLAAMMNRSLALESMLEAGADVNALNSGFQYRIDLRGAGEWHSSVYGGCTPLIVAAEHGAGEAVKVLLRHHADLEACDPAGNTALHMACRTKNFQVVQDLIAAGADVNARINYGGTPLIMASANSTPAVVQLLLDAGADIHAADEEGYTALLEAAWEGRAETAKLLLSRGAKTEVEMNLQGYKRPLEMGDFWDALNYKRRTSTLRVLLPHLDCNAPNRKCSPLRTAVLYEHWAAVSLMIEAGARHYEGETLSVMGRGKRQPLQQARAVRALAKLGHLPSNADFEQAVAEDLRPVVRSMVEHGSNPSHGLHFAKEVEMVDLLVSLGANVNAPNETGEFPLQSAVRTENIPVIKRLRALGADPMARDARGHTAVDLAQLAPKDLKSMFEAHTPDPASVATLRLRQLLGEKRPPLLSDVEQLIHEGADVNLMVEPGITALTAALSLRAWDLADALIRAGATSTWESETLTIVRQIIEEPSPRWQTDVDIVSNQLGALPKSFTNAKGAVLYSLDSQVEIRTAELIAIGEVESSARFDASQEVSVEWVERLSSLVEQKWCGLWRPARSNDAQLLLVDQPNLYAVIAFTQFHGSKLGAAAVRLITFLREWEQLDLVLTEVAGRYLEFKIEKFPHDFIAWFKELRIICPGMRIWSDEEIEGWPEVIHESHILSIQID